MRLEPGNNLRAKALLFDMDGTLLISKAVIERVYRRWAALHGLDPEVLLAASHGCRTIDTVTRFCPPGVDAVSEAERLAREEREDVAGIVPIEGVVEFLRSLPRERWAVVTSADRGLADVRLQAAGIPLPDIIITAEDVSAGKPDPEGYAKAARLLGFEPAETIVFEDAPAGLLAGRNAGARTLALATTLRPDELAGEDWISDYRAIRAREEGGDLVVGIPG
ncbi:sugar-phosphatase [Faunimonas pinastri]|uniref:Sugar-phosphatase n=1 Tax=Faunimonas pinastri TaxID=1855383 RepID=A0A1H9PX08_9HYPH|nr:HAD-IA family hydrolase [Faunimonas pinastri]SER52700.1 sugar-phosphatase [Faunimonas pinastri]